MCDLVAKGVDKLAWRGVRYLADLQQKGTSMLYVAWQGVTAATGMSYTCGHCGAYVGPDTAYRGTRVSGGADMDAHIYICPNCNEPTYCYDAKQIPAARYGEDVKESPKDIGMLYDEARNSMSASAYTCSALACRRLLMNIAVQKGAQPGWSFKKYIEYLDENNIVPQGGEPWLQHIREKGNEATHEIHVIGKTDAEDLIDLVHMLLTLTFEYPARMRKKTPSPDNKD